MPCLLTTACALFGEGLPSPLTLSHPGEGVPSPAKPAPPPAFTILGMFASLKPVARLDSACVICIHTRAQQALPAPQGNGQ